MKKLTKWMLLAVSLCLAALTGCSNLVSGATVIGENATSDNTKTLTIIATGDSNYVTFDGSGARMILPDALDSSGLDFYLWGTNKLGTTDTSLSKPSKVNFYPTSGSNNREGSVELDLPTSQYELSLAAVPTGTSIDTSGADETVISAVKTAMNLYATATVDMRYNERVNFYLTPYTVSGTGNVALTLKLASGFTLGAPYTTAGNVKVSINNINTNDIITGTEIATAALSTALNTSAGYDYSSTNAAALGSVPAGTYNLKVTFTDTNPDPDKNYIWSDTILVLNNQITSGTVTIPNVIGTKPKDPDTFTARFNDPENAESGFYDVEFLWKDNSNNEHYFQIDLMDVTTVTSDQATALATFTTTPNDTNWSAITGLTTTSYTNSIYSESIYVDGNLNANSESVVMNLPLGNRYIARLSAVNDAGNSSYVYLNLAVTDATYAAGSKIPSVGYKRRNGTAVSTLKSFDTTAVVINRFRINYNLNGGAYYAGTYTGAAGTDLKISTIGSTAATQSTISTLNGTATKDVRYYSQIPAGNKILNPLYTPETAATPATYYVLAKNKKYWTGWKLNSNDGKTVYRIDPAYTTSTCDQDLKGIPSTDATFTEAATYYKTQGSDWAYPGCANLYLMAVYGNADVTIMNPADYQILAKDVLVYKGTSDAIASAIQVATLDSAKSFNVNTSTEKDASSKPYGYSHVFIAVNNTNYSKLTMTVTSQANGVVTEVTGTTKTTGYALTTKQPSDWATNYTAYYTKDAAKGTYTAVPAGTPAAAPNWAADTYYKNATDNFTYFTLPARTSYAPGSAYLITINGYNDKIQSSPFTYLLTMNLTNTAANQYDVTTVCPENFNASTGATYGNYYTESSGTYAAVGAATDWASDTYYQKR